MKTKAQILADAKRELAEIEQYFNDIAHWNKTRGKLEGIIEADPDGSMHRIQDQLTAFLAINTI